MGLDGRLRLDALARYLQAAAEGDLAGAGYRSTYDWVVRRCAVRVHSYPRLGQRLRVRTFCSAIGPRWAERTTTLADGDGDGDDADGDGDAELVRATAVWAAVDSESGRPSPLGPDFLRVYGPSAPAHRVGPAVASPPTDQADAEPWPLRAADFDTSGHVNNAVYWAAVEDAVARLGWLPAVAEVEYHLPRCPAASPGCSRLPRPARPGPGC